MQIVPIGVTARVTFELIDANGDPVTPTELSVAVRDKNDVVLMEESVSFDPGDTEVVISVPQSVNHTDAADDIRAITLTVTTADGTFDLDKFYLLRGSVRLEILKNSFQTFASAKLIAAQRERLIGWENANDFSRQNALAEAFRRLTRLGYRVREPSDIYMDRIHAIDGHDIYLDPRSWPLMDMPRWESFPEHFRKTMNAAQVIEANEILRVDPIADRRRAGLFAETIGDSKMMFRPGLKPLDLGISPVTAQELTGFLELRLTTTRS